MPETATWTLFSTVTISVTSQQKFVATVPVKVTFTVPQLLRQKKTAATLKKHKLHGGAWR
jgi:hypothetical protein